MAAVGGAGSTLEVRLVGELGVLRGGVAQRLPASKKARALLAYLVATGRPHLREALCTLLWDGPDDPRAGVRWALSKIRPLIDGGVARLVGDREHVCFEAQGAEVDLDRLRAIAAAGVAATDTAALSAAVPLFRGNFLEGLDLPGCHRFHAWCLAEREALRTLEIAVRSALLERLDRTPALALPHARALLALDPLSESSHITVVRLLGELGRTREALDAYEQCRLVLERDLGARPSRELERARMRLGQPPVEAGAAEEVRPAAPAVLAPRGGDGSPALLGRERERRELVQHLDRAAVGRQRSLVLLIGEAGVGKTRLLSELAAEARARQGRWIGGKAFEAEMVRPYGVWIEALRPAGLEALAPATRTDLAPLFPELGGEPRASDRARLFEGVKQALTDLGRGAGPLVVILDDLQWLDEGSAALLHYLVRALEGAPVLFACAAREGELGDNPAALRLCRALERDRRLARLPLLPLGPADAEALVRAVGGPADAARVFAEAEGNPLYTIEIARALQAGQAAPAATLESLIAERLERLEPAARSLLPWAAALGRSFDPQLLAAVTGRPLPELCATLDDLERRQVVRGAGASGYDFTHDLIRRAVYHRMPDARRRLVHLQIARSLAPLAEQDDALAGELGHHASLGGDAETATRAYLAAGERCLRVFAWGDARELARRGRREAEGVGGQRGLRLRLGLVAVEVVAQPSDRRHPEVERELAAIVAECGGPGLQAELAHALYLRSRILYQRGEWHQAQTTSLSIADVHSDADPLARAGALAETARCLLMIEKDVGRGQELVDESRRLLNGATESLSLCWSTGLLARFTGAAEEAEHWLTRTLAMARQSGRRWEEQECLRGLAMLDLERGRPEMAVQRCAELCQVAEKMSDQGDSAAANALAAVARLCAAGPAGDPGDLDRHLELLRKADSKAILAFVQNVAAQWELTFGAPTRVRERAGEALGAASAIERSSQIVLATALLARAALLEGDRAAAERALPHLSPAGPLEVSAFAAHEADRARQALGRR
jgi:DNA-binding SARP family transcriptional activator